MLCRVEMPNNEQIFGRFYRYRMFHGGASGGVGFFTLPVVLFILCACLFVGGTDYFFPTALLAVGVFYTLYLLYLKPVLRFRAKPGAALLTEVTVFTGTGLTHSVRSEEGGLPDNQSISYDGLLKAVETSQDFYLFTAPDQAILIDKTYFTNGSPEELREMLKTAMGERLKKKC